jgi:outer membrane lipoprotein SlyB
MNKISFSFHRRFIFFFYDYSKIFYGPAQKTLKQIKETKIMVIDTIHRDRFKKVVSLMSVLVLLVLTISCTQRHTKGAGIGAAVGGIAGAILDSKNSWRGAVIGGALGAIAGATIADISAKASKEAIRENKPVEYRTTDGRGVYRADPVQYDPETKCHKVRERVWEDGKLIKDEVKEICESDKIVSGY